jgi:hypothetical protein
MTSACAAREQPALGCTTMNFIAPKRRRPRRGGFGRAVVALIVAASACAATAAQGSTTTRECNVAGPATRVMVTAGSATTCRFAGETFRAVLASYRVHGLHFDETVSVSDHTIVVSWVGTKVICMSPTGHAAYVSFSIAEMNRQIRLA